MCSGHRTPARQDDHRDPVPANDRPRRQNTANALFFHSLTSNLRNGAVFRAYTIRQLRIIIRG